LAARGHKIQSSIGHARYRVPALAFTTFDIAVDRALAFTCNLSGLVQSSTRFPDPIWYVFHVYAFHTKFVRRFRGSRTSEASSHHGIFSLRRKQSNTQRVPSGRFSRRSPSPSSSCISRSSGLHLWWTVVLEESDRIVNLILTFRIYCQDVQALECATFGEREGHHAYHELSLEQAICAWIHIMHPCMHAATNLFAAN
jgi:hypothetical protein